MVRLGEGGRTGNYVHIFGNILLGQLITDTHSAMIRMGNTLERIVLEKCRESGTLIGDFDRFIEECETDEGRSKYGNVAMVLSKRTAKKSRKFRTRAAEPDFMVFLLGRRECKVIELKLGANFDTKKSQGEVDALEEVKTTMGAIMPFRVNSYVCSFMAATRQEIVSGFKNRITAAQAMTGREFCELLRLDYGAIRADFESDAEYNREAFAKRIMSIPEMVRLIKRRINGHDD